MQSASHDQELNNQPQYVNHCFRNHLCSSLALEPNGRRVPGFTGISPQHLFLFGTNNLSISLVRWVTPIAVGPQYLTIAHFRGRQVVVEDINVMTTKGAEPPVGVRRYHHPKDGIMSSNETMSMTKAASLDTVTTTPTGVA